MPTQCANLVPTVFLGVGRRYLFTIHLRLSQKKLAWTLGGSGRWEFVSSHGTMAVVFLLSFHGAACARYHPFWWRAYSLPISPLHGHCLPTPNPHTYMSTHISKLKTCSSACTCNLTCSYECTAHSSRHSKKPIHKVTHHTLSYQPPMLLPN